MLGTKTRVRYAALAGLAGLWIWIFAPSAQAFEVTLSAGNKPDLAETLRGGSLLFEITEKAQEEEIAPQEVIATAQADYQRLLAVLYNQGYFGPEIRISVDGREAASLDSVAPPRIINRITITVDTGNRFHFGMARVAPLAPGTTMPEGFAAGEQASLGAMRGAADAAVSGWRDVGHAKAEIARQRITANHRAAELDADLTVAPGPKLRFGQLVVEGNKNVRRDRIIEIASLPEGEQFSPKEIEDAAARLRRTGTFRSVAMIEAKTPVEGDTLPITARVTENKPRRFGFGGEIATQEGITLSGYWMHRNLFGGAEKLRVDAEIAGIAGSTGGTDYYLGTRYERPATFNEDTTFVGLAELEQLNQESFDSRSISFGAGIIRRASDTRAYRFGLGIRHADTRDALGEEDYTLLMMPAGLTFDYRDVELDARRGYYASADFTPFLAAVGTDNGLLTEMDYRRYFTFGEARPTTLAVRAQLGSLIGPSLKDAPADFLFYSGGGGTVRGHEFQSLGVDIGGDDEIGGRSFLGLSAELRMRTSGALGFVGFIDAGYIGSEAFPDGSGEWQSGAGIGVRYATAIGPIRVDLAVPTSGDDRGSDFQIYIGIGQSF